MLNIFNIIFNILAYKIIGDINIFNINIKLRVLYKSDYVLIIIKNHDNCEIKIV